MNLIDTHFHIIEMTNKGIDIIDFFNNWEKNKNSILLDIGINEDNFDYRYNFSKSRNYLFHTVGIHPNMLTDNFEKQLDTIQEQAKFKKVIAIGEIGLDYFRHTNNIDLQKKSFIQQIELSIELNLPVIIHNRDADEDMFNILSKFKGKCRGIIHCFSSTPKYAKKFIDLGFYISFSGNITYKKSFDIQESLKIIPLNRLLFETDSPYLSPQKVRGTINTPNNIKYTINYISSSIGLESSLLISTVKENFMVLMDIKEEK